jgi:hypothetical protein
MRKRDVGKNDNASDPGCAYLINNIQSCIEEKITTYSRHFTWQSLYTDHCHSALIGYWAARSLSPQNTSRRPSFLDQKIAHRDPASSNLTAG